MNPTLRWSFALLLVLGATPAAAQWSRVPGLPASDVFSVWAQGDTITAGVDTAAYVSTDAGATWKRSARVAPGVTSVQAVRIRNGRLYAATYGQGVFVSDDLGDTWADYNQGLVGGFLDSQLFASDMLIDGGHLYLATSGAGVWVRDLSGGGWSLFGNELEADQGANVNGIAAGNGRLVACAGFNGTTFYRDPGDPDWTLSLLESPNLAPGLGAISAIWTGQRWVVGTNIGVFVSALGQEPWTFVGPQVSSLFNLTFAQRGPDLFAAFSETFDTLIGVSHDDGASWEGVDFRALTFVYGLATIGNDLYAAQADGLWRRSVATVSVPAPPPAPGIAFAMLGPHPVRDEVRFRFELPEPGGFTLEVFDAAGRRVGETVRARAAAGAGEIGWRAAALVPGVYLARLTAGARQGIVRFVRIR